MCVDRGRWVMHDGISYDPIQGQGQGHRGLKVAKMADFEVSFASLHVIKYSKTVSKIEILFRQIFDIHPHSASLNLLTWCSTFDKWILPLTRSWPAVLYVVYFSCLFRSCTQFWWRKWLVTDWFTCLNMLFTSIFRRLLISVDQCRN